jgi:hypothetical protein
MSSYSQTPKMIPDPKPIPYAYDSIVNFTMGIDSSKAPDLLAEGYSAFAVNSTFRGGKSHARPRFRELVVPDQANKEGFQYFKHQGEEIYQDLQNDTAHMLAVRGGYVYKVDLDTLELTLLNPSDKNNADRRHYFCQADKFLIIQNGEDIPFIYDGAALRRSKTGTNNVANPNVSINQTGGVATVVTTNKHNLVPGSFVTITGNIAPAAYIGNYRVVSTPDEYTYTIRVTSTLAATASPAGDTYHPFEVPTGLFMEYAIGRLCVVSPDRRTMQIGDIIRSTPNTQAVESVLWFTEQEYLSEGFVFSLPASQGRIRSVKAIPFMGAPTGQGDIAVSGDKGFSTLSLLTTDRTQWRSTPGIQKVALTGIGCASQTGQVGFNGDILFRDLEYGVRTFRLADARFTKNPGQTPISSEMDRIFSKDDKDKLQFVSMVAYDNRLLTTVTPVYAERRIMVQSISSDGISATITLEEPALHEAGDKIRLYGTTFPNDQELEVSNVISPTILEVTTNLGSSQGAGGFLYSNKTGAEYYHKGLAVLDYNTLSGAQGAAQAAWDGLWTGLNVQGLNKAYLSGAPRLIISSYNTTLYRNELWELDIEAGPDIGEFGETYPTRTLETRSLSCKDDFGEKKLLGLNIFLTDVVGNVSGEIFYANDGDRCWRPWATFDICATADGTPEPETSEFSDGLLQAMPQRRMIRIGQPPDGQCEITTTSDARLFYETQLKIKLTGNAVLDKLQLMALTQIQDMRGGCWS